METQHDIMIANKRDVQYKFSIRRKITIICGDSATGKSTLVQMVDAASSVGKTGINVSCDVPLKALHTTGYQYELANERGNIYFVDEDFSELTSKEFASLILASDNCFVIVTRLSLPMIPYSYTEIFGIKTSGKFHMLERLYDDCTDFCFKDRIVTEDADAGLEYYQYYFGDRVSSSYGNSNLSKFGNKDTLLIGDGSAIGPYIQDLILTEADLYLPESFEWVLLGNGMFDSIEQVQRILMKPSNVDTRYISTEQYCVELLTNLTRNTPAQYTKSRLNPCYVSLCCCKHTICQFFTKGSKDATNLRGVSHDIDSPTKINI